MTLVQDLQTKNIQFFIHLLKQATCWAKQIFSRENQLDIREKTEILLAIKGLPHSALTIAYKKSDIQRCSGNSQK